MAKKRAPLNRTLILTKKEISVLKTNLLKNINDKITDSKLTNKIISGDLFKIYNYLPDKFVDLMFIDPPYNLHKKFNKHTFKEMNDTEYEIWMDSWLSKLVRLLKPDASVYLCGDWRSSGAIYNVAKKYFYIQNRITWEREKGRGAKSNWKNCAEDIWFCTMKEKFLFNVDDVKLKRKVMAPYKVNGSPKDWATEENKNFRITHPSNLWTDITIPFWSMPENTDHPTQKPEKLLAKIILASSKKGDMVFDPFLGSGTTAVVAKKLDRKYSGVEMDITFCCLAEKRLLFAEKNKSIQGYENGVFWERNSLREQKLKK